MNLEAIMLNEIYQAVKDNFYIPPFNINEFLHFAAEVKVLDRKKVERICIDIRSCTMGKVRTK